MTQSFEKPKFQNLIQYFFNSHCDMEEQVKQLDLSGRRHLHLLSTKTLTNGGRLILNANPEQKYRATENKSRQQQILSGGNHSVKNDHQQTRKPALPSFLARPIKVFIFENVPDILISDGHNYIEAEFTKESIYEFRKNFSHMKFSSLKDKVI